MPSLHNPKHEAFAQELAKGKSQVEAYELAGFKNGQKNAHRLGSDEGILRRVAEIQAERSRIEQEATEKAAEALSIDKQWVMSQLIKNATQAAQEANYAPSNKALELLGKELGMFKERVEMSGPNGGAMTHSIEMHIVDPKS